MKIDGVIHHAIAAIFLSKFHSYIQRASFDHEFMTAHRSSSAKYVRIHL